MYVEEILSEFAHLMLLILIFISQRFCSLSPTRITLVVEEYSILYLSL